MLLSPEQAVSKPFRNALSRPELQSKIGLVAIDECHLVKQWESFRPEFSMIGQLRMLLQQDILWFGCSATLSREGEQHVLQNAGFRSLGCNPWQTEVIRTSIDRADLFICVRPILRGKLSSFETLYFLLDAAMEADKATPERIPKTIIFIDSVGKVDKAADYLRTMLLSKTATSTSERYTERGDGPYSVYNVVHTFTSHVSGYDQDVRFDEFKTSSSIIRIMVATTSLGMGINVADIDCTVVWKFPIGFDICDAWQRLGRGGRGEGRRSKGYILLPYWLFDSEGIEKPKEPQEFVRTPMAKPTYSKSGNKSRHSQLIESYTPGDISDTESISSVLSSQTCKTKSQVKYWTKKELESRAGVPDYWKEIANGTCHRRPFLSYLGEEKLPEGAEVISIPREECCSRCNPSLIPPFTIPPKPPNPVTQPRSGTRAYFALELISKWAALQADLVYNHPDRRYPMPPTAFMDIKCQWQLAGLYNSDNPTLGNTLDDVKAKVPLLHEWQYREEYGGRLFEQLQNMVAKVRQTYADISQKRKDKAKAQNKELPNGQQEERNMSRLNATERYIEATRKKDDTLAIQVARRAAAKRSELHCARIGSPPRSPVPVPSTPRHVTSISLGGSAYSPSISAEVSSKVLTNSQSSPTATSTRKRKGSQRPETPNKRRPLAERNINEGLVFTPVTRSGRVRIPTQKGRDNFYIEK